MIFFSWLMCVDADQFASTGLRRTEVHLSKMFCLKIIAVVKLVKSENGGYRFVHKHVRMSVG